MLFQDFKERIN